MCIQKSLFYYAWRIGESFSFEHFVSGAIFPLVIHGKYKDKMFYKDSSNLITRCSNSLRYKSEGSSEASNTAQCGKGLCCPRQVSLEDVYAIHQWFSYVLTSTVSITSGPTGNHGTSSGFPDAPAAPALCGNIGGM